MRLLLVLILCGVTLGLPGCGGGGDAGPAHPLTAQPHTLRVTGIHSVYGFPQMPIQETYGASAQLWMPQNAAMLDTVTLATAWNPGLRLHGPTLIPPTDGTNQTGLPYAVLWGQASAIPESQPQFVQPHQPLPGYLAPVGELYGYTGSCALGEARNLGGDYTLTADSGYTHGWTLSPQPLLPTATITEPEPFIYTMEAKKPFVVSWDAVPGAVGYFVCAEAEVKNPDDAVIGIVVWTVADRPIIPAAVYDFTPYLLPASARRVTMPAGIFNGCESVRVDLYAFRAPVLQQSGDLVLSLVNASLTSQVYVVVNE